MTQLPLPQPTIRWPYAYVSCPTRNCPWVHEQNVDPGPIKITVPNAPTLEDLVDALATRSNTFNNQWTEQVHQALNDHLTEQHNTTLATLAPPPLEPAPVPKALQNLIDKHPHPTSPA
ncbi:hypothetical protein [Nocardiopsis alba]|uniref:hypothetical protein n=1 Tax=Nocardiopsis alba TaxID=53437 RepID=UPI0033ADA1E5